MKSELQAEAKKNISVDPLSNGGKKGFWERAENYFKSPDTIVLVLFRPAFVVYLGVLLMMVYFNQNAYLPILFLTFPSIVLAVVTIMYVLLTRDLVKTNQVMVNAQSQPKFSIDFDYVKYTVNNATHISTVVYIRNSGDVARNLKISFNPNWEFLIPPITVLSIVRGERITILEELNIIREIGRILKIELDYENMFSQKYHDRLVLSQEQLQNLRHPHTIETIKDIDNREILNRLITEIRNCNNVK